METEIIKQFEISMDALIRMDTFMKVLQDFSTKWSLKTEGIHDTLLSILEAIKELEILKLKCLRSNKCCCVLGKISSGKSTLINALIGQKVLPTGFGTTTKCFIEVKASPNDENYVLRANETEVFTKEDLGHLEAECLKKEDNSQTFIKVLMSTEDNRYLKNNFTIIDTPGIGNQQYEDYIGLLSRDSDLLISVVSSISEFGRLEKEVILSHRNKFTTYDIVIVFNFWDIPNENDDFMQVRQRHEKNAFNFLDNEIKRFDLRKDQRNVFFISSSEAFKHQMQVKVTDLKNIDSRKEEFLKLKDRLQTEVNESSYNRRIRILRTVDAILNEVFENATKCFDLFQLEIVELAEKIKSQIEIMPGFVTLNDQINKDVKKVFKTITESVIKTGKKIVEKKSDENSVGLSCLVKDIFDTEYKKLKEKINDTIITTDCDEFCKNILKEIYLVRYFNYGDELNNDNEEIRKNLMILNKASKIQSGLHTGFNSALSAASVASGGISVGAVAAVETVTSMAGLVTGKNLSIFHMLGYLSKPFHLIWDKEEGNIRKQFVEIEDGLRDSLKHFPEKADVDIIQIIEPLKENFNILKEYVDDVNGIRSKFYMSSFIYM